jgi:hypothetical protein
MASEMSRPTPDLRLPWALLDARPKIDSIVTLTMRQLAIYFRKNWLASCGGMFRLDRINTDLFARAVSGVDLACFLPGIWQSSGRGAQSAGIPHPRHDRIGIEVRGLSCIAAHDIYADAADFATA